MSRKQKKARAVPVGIGILVFILAFGAGALSKTIQPGWARRYAVKWSDAIGTLMSDLPYGDGAANKFDLYLPKDDSKDACRRISGQIHARGVNREIV